MMFGNFSKLDSPRRLVQFWQNFQTSLVLLIPNCTRQRMIIYTYVARNVMVIKDLVNIDYFMVDECVRFLFTSCERLLRTSERSERVS